MSDNNSDTHLAQKSDKRYFPRWDVGSRASYAVSDDRQVFEGVTKDLSCAGVCIIGDGHISPKQKIKVSIELSEGTSISLNGYILWVKSEDGRRHMGVNFYDTPDDVQELILKHAFELDRTRVLSHWFKGWDGSK